MNRIQSTTFSAVLMTLLFPGSASAQKPISIAVINRSDLVDFELEVLPIFRRSCLACHSTSEANGTLVLETPATILKGGDSGPAVVANNGAESLLLKVAAHQTDPIMPPPDNDVGAKTLTTQELGLLKLWIDQGATGIVRGVISPQNWRPLPRGVSPIYATTLTRDGQFAAAGRANQICIYHVPSGQLVTKLTDPALVKASADPRPGIAHLDLIQSLTFNRAGDMLASGGFRTIKLWRRPRDVRRLKLTTPEALTAVAASPDGAFLATVSADNIIRLWNRESGEASFNIEGHTAAVSALAFLPQSSRLASASSDGSVRFWNLFDGSPAGLVQTPAEVTDLAILPGGTRMATAHADGVARYWSIPSGPTTLLTEVVENATVVAVSPDRLFLATANAAGTIHVVDVDCGQLLDISWQAHDGAITALSFSSEGSLLASGGADGVARVWHFEPGSSVATDVTGGLRGSLAPLTAIALRSDGKELTTGTATGEVTVWNLEATAVRSLAALSENALDVPQETSAESDTTEAAIEPPLLVPNGSAATVATVSPNGKLLAVSGTVEGRPAILVRDLTTGELTASLTGHLDQITSLSFAANNQQLISGSADQTARVWDLADAKFPEVISSGGHAATILGVAFNSDGSQAATCAADNSVQLWNTTTGEVIQRLVGHTAAVVGIAIAPGNTEIITASADKTVRVWTAADGKIARTITAPAAISRMAVSRDGTRIAVAQTDRIVQIYKAADGALVQTLAGHQEAVSMLTFSGDGTRLMSADANRAIVRDSASGRVLEIFPVAQGISAAVFGATAAEVILARSDTGINLHSLKFKIALGEMAKAITGIACAADGSVYTASLDGTVRRFSTANGVQTFSAVHGSPVNDLALSPGGQLLASAGDDRNVKLWTASNGAAQPNPVLSEFTETVRQLEFSPDSTRLVVASAVADEVHVFDVALRSREQILVGQPGAVIGLAIVGTAQPAVIAVSTVKDQSTVQRFPLLHRRRISGHTMPLTSVAAIPGPVPQIVTGSRDGTVRQWNLLTGAVVRNMNHGAPVTDVAVRGDGLRFASSAENNTAQLWNSANGASVAILKGDIRLLNQLNRDEQELALVTAKVAASEESLQDTQALVPMKAAIVKTSADALSAANAAVTQANAKLKAVATTKALAEQKAVQTAAAAQAATAKKRRADEASATVKSAAARAVDKAARAKVAATADPQNKTLVTLAAAAETTSKTVTAMSTTVADAAIAADTAAKTAVIAATTAATMAVAAGKPYTDALITLRAARATQNTAAQASALAASEAKTAAEAVPVAQVTLKADQDRMTELTVQVETSKKAVADVEQPIRTVAFSPDGRLLATGGDDQMVHTWSAETGEAMTSFVGHTGTVDMVTFAGNSELLSGSEDKGAFVWNAEPDWILERTIGSIEDAGVLADRVMALDFNTDGSLLVAGGGVPSRSGEVKLFSTSDGSLVRSLPEPHTDGVQGVRFSPDGSMIATCGADKYVRVFQTATGELIRPFEGHTEYVLGVAWKADGRTLASCGADATIRVWNAATGELSRTITGFDKQVTDIRFIGDSINTVSSSGDKTVRLHRTDNGQNFRTFTGATDFIYCVAATPDSRFIIAGSFDSVLRIWNGTNGTVLHELSPARPTVETVTADDK